MERIKTNKAREEFGSVVNRVAYGKEWIVLERRNREMAAMIPMEDLRLLKRLIEEEEDRIDLEKVKDSMADPGESIPLDEVMEELGIGTSTRSASPRRKERPKKVAKG